MELRQRRRSASCPWARTAENDAPRKRIPRDRCNWMASMFALMCNRRLFSPPAGLLSHVSSQRQSMCLRVPQGVPMKLPFLAIFCAIPCIGQAQATSGSPQEDRSALSVQPGGSSPQAQRPVDRHRLFPPLRPHAEVHGAGSKSHLVQSFSHGQIGRQILAISGERSRG